MKQIVKGLTLTLALLQFACQEGGEAPNPEVRSTLLDNRYLLLEQGAVVRDITTGLEWQRCALGQHWDNGRCLGEALLLTWQQAQEREAASWRLPELGELSSLIYCSNGQGYGLPANNSSCSLAGSFSSPTIHQRAFPQSLSHGFWTATAAGQNVVEQVSFTMGQTAPASIFEPMAVRLVRTVAPVTLNFHTFRPQEEQLWRRINAEQRIPGVTVNFTRISNNDYEANTKAALQQANGPDFFSGKAGANWLANFTNDDLLLSMADLQIQLGSILPSALAAVTSTDQQHYGVPYAVQLQSLIYDQTTLAALGASVPTTLAEFERLLALAKAEGKIGLTVAGMAGWYLNQVFNEVVMAGLVSDADQQAFVDGNKCFTDAPFVAALERIAAWRPYMDAAPTATDYGIMRTNVAVGDALFMADGGWSTGPASPMYELNPDFKPGFMAIPGANGKTVAHADGGYLVNANSQKLEAVQAVLAFMTTEQFGQLFVEEVSEPTAVKGNYQSNNSALAAVLIALANSASVEPFVEYSLNQGSPSYGDLIAQQLPLLLSGEATAQQVAQSVQRGLNSWNYIGAANCVVAP